MKQVYFLRPVGMDGPIKIGCSVQPIGRLRSIELFSPLKLEIAAIAPGGHIQESALHYMFADHRRHGEWFEAVPALIALVNEVAETGVLPSLSPATLSRKERPKRALPKRVSEASRQRSKLSARVSSAERYSYGYFERGHVRPDEIAAVFSRWADGYNIAATDEEVALLTAYIEKLRAGPKADRSFAAWTRWHNQRRAGQFSPTPFIAEPTKPEAVLA